MTQDSFRHIYETLFDAFGPQHWWPGRTPLEICVGAILTQNTAWSNVEKAIANLRAARKLSVRGLNRMAESECADLIRPAGYFNVKTRRLKNFTRMLERDFGSSLKRLARLKTMEIRYRLLDVNGIGQETADSILLYALDKPVFVVDAYTRRIFSRHGLISGAETYDEIQAMFRERLPADRQLYNEFHALIVTTGKQFCRRTPRCGECPLRGCANRTRQYKEKQ